MHHDDKEVIDALEAQDATSDLGETTKESGSGRMGHTKSLLKNWQLMSAITLYCVFSLHDTAYLEVIPIFWIIDYRSNKKGEGRK